MSYSINFSKLHKYFLNIYNKKEEMKNITKIALDTGISTSTISRYAIRNGYYSFPAMRAKFNERLKISRNYVEKDQKIFEEILNYKNVYVLSSKSSHLIGRYLNDRLKQIHVNSQFVDFSVSVDSFIEKINGENAGVVFVSTTAESLRLKMIHERLKNRIIIISTVKKEEYFKKGDNNMIVLRDYKPLTYSSFDKNNAIIKIINWINEIVNLIIIEKDKEI